MENVQDRISTMKEQNKCIQNGSTKSAFTYHKLGRGNQITLGNWSDVWWQEEYWSFQALLWVSSYLLFRRGTVGSPGAPLGCGFLQRWFSVLGAVEKRDAPCR
jgi:hypothetical protein